VAPLVTSVMGVGTGKGVVVTVLTSGLGIGFVVAAFLAFLFLVVGTADADCIIMLAVAEGLEMLVMVMDSALEHLFAGFAFVLALVVGWQEVPSISRPGTREGTTGKGRIGSESPMVLAGIGDGMIGSESSLISARLLRSAEVGDRRSDSHHPPTGVGNPASLKFQFECCNPSANEKLGVMTACENESEDWKPA
jgi:hypothetical protein